MDSCIPGNVWQTSAIRYALDEMEGLEEDAPNDRAFPTTGKTLARCASWDGEKL